jgi:hypothetical protein
MGTEINLAQVTMSHSASEMLAEAYNYVMAATQWAMTQTNLAGSTIAAGMAGQALMQQALGQFRVGAQPLSVHGRDPTGASGSIFSIQFRYSGSEEYTGFELKQEISKGTSGANTDGMLWSKFVLDTGHPLSNQQSTKHGITATDQAGKWELGHRPGSALSSLNPVAHFSKFGQMMRSSAFGIGQDSSRAFLGSHTWSAIYEEGHSPQYQGIGSWFSAGGY